MKWTKEKDKELLELYNSNLSRKEIADKLGVTVNSAIHRIDTLGLKRENRNYKRFTDEQVKDIINKYQNKSARQIAKEYNVASETIRRVLHKNGIETSSYRWSKSEEEHLRELCKNEKLSIEEIAKTLGRTESAVYKKASLLGIDIISQRREWKQWEDEFLLTNWGCKTLSYISNKLNRSTEACILRAKHLKLGGALKNTEYVLLVDFCKAVGISKEVVIKTWQPLGFKIRYLKTTRKRQFKAVDLNESLTWMEKHQDLFDGSLVDELFFLPEPDWLKAKRKADKVDKTNIKLGKKKQYWSDLDIQRLKCQLGLGMTHQEIANSLGKSLASVNYKVSQLNLGYKAKKFWTGQEFRFIRDNWEHMTDAELAKQLNRPVRSVELHRQQMGFKRR